jgi:hypothetical protein
MYYLGESVEEKFTQQENRQPSPARRRPSTRQNQPPHQPISNPIRIAQVFWPFAAKTI